MSDLAKRLARLSPEKRALLERRMKAEKSAPPQSGASIAVIGIGCRYPGGANSPDAYWDLLAEGVDAVREVPDDRWSAEDLYDPDSTVRGKMATRWGGFLDDIDKFDPAFFEITDREAIRMDPQQRLLLETTWEALEDAGIIAGQLAGSATGVFVGAHNLSSDYFVRQLFDRYDIDPYSATGGAHSILANRLSYWLDLQGPSFSVDTACSAALVAGHLAVNSLRSGESDLAILGAVNLILSPETTIALSGLQMMASDGRCKTFDASADGFVRGEGCGAVILKRLEDAQRDGDSIYALIRGSAVNQDGRTNGLTAPNGLSQQKVINQALRHAGVDATQIGYVETHGTGTAMGDPIEVEALSEVIGKPDNGLRCALGAVKTNIGHLEAAAGLAGLIKAVLCLHRGFIPPNLHYTKTNPHISLDGTRFVVPKEGLDWSAAEEPRFAGVSSFGFGGTNAHIVLEEAPATAVSDNVDDATDPLLVISARDDDALKDMAAAYRDALAMDESSYRDVCYTAACRRTHHERRLAVLEPDHDSALGALDAYLRGDAAENVLHQESSMVEGPGQAWVFSGQGSQRVGMGQRLLQTEPVFRQKIEHIDELLGKLAGWSLLEELQTADEDRLGHTEFAQPAIFAMQVGLAVLLQYYGVRPDAVVGHSLGEVAAAHVAGCLTLEDAVTVIYHRGKLMQKLHGAGKMAVVTAREADVRDRIAAGHDGVTIAAVNGPFAVTVSGAPDAIDTFVAGLESPHRLMPVHYAFHSLQMDPLKNELVAALDGIEVREPELSVYSTVRGGLAEPGDFGPEYWARNIREPVAFANAIETLIDAGTSQFTELAPQAVLGPAIEQCLDGRRHRAAVVGVLLRSRPEEIGFALSSLFVNGVAVDWSNYYGSGANVVRLPTYAWQRKRCWFEPSARSDSGADRETDIGDWCYQVAWPIRTPFAGWVSRAAADGFAPLAAVTDAVEAKRGDAYRKHGAEDSRELVAMLEKLSVEYAAQSLQQLGFELHKGASYSREDIDSMVPGYGRRIVARLFGLLAEQGAMTAIGESWRVTGNVPGPVDVPTMHGDAAAVLELLERCGEQVANVVLQKTDPLSLLFPDDYSTSAEWIYADAPFSRVANDLVADTVAALCDPWPESRTLRVLEIGAGTGGTTRKVLPLLNKERTEYVFTDLSRSFLNQAEERFGRDLPIRCEILDLEQNPAAQGFEGQQFDLIIAANVVHATADVGQALCHAKELLVPGGALLLLEGTARRGWIDLTFGLTDGWWRFTDTGLRADHPLLSAEQWEQVLSETGFAEVMSAPAQGDSEGSLFQQSIIIARTPQDEVIADSTPAPRSVAEASPWVVFADRAGVSAALAEQLEAAGTPCVVVEQPKAACPGAFHEVLTDIADKYGTAPAVVIDLGAIDETDTPDAQTDWDARMTGACGSMLHLIQAMENVGMVPSRGLWIATRGTQPVMLDGDLSLVQAPLWGLGRVAAREKPELWGGLVDLDFTSDVSGDAARLRAVIESEDGENQVVLRSGDRFVARFVDSVVDPGSPPTIRDDRSYLVTGGLGGIGLQVAQWLVENGARHLTLMGRSGLRESAVSDVKEFEAAGVSVTVEAADVADARRMTELFAAFGETRPALAGVIHTAAAVKFLPLDQIALDDLLHTLQAKVAGTWQLHKQTADRDLDFFVLFSSMATIAGFQQLGHYAAGNAFMDAMAHQRRKSGLPALSINWGLWSDGRLTSADNIQHIERIGLRAMPSESALQGLETALSNDAAQIAFSAIDWETFKPIYESRGARRFLSRLDKSATTAVDNVEAASQTSELLEELRGLNSESALRRLESAISGEVASILRIDVSKTADREEGFFQMGMDSIMTVELRRRLERQLQAQLPTTLAFEYPTTRRLAEFLASEYLGFAADLAAPVDSADDSDELDSFSDLELEAELDRQLAELEDGSGSTAN